jgi:hypothetical protein
MGLASSSTPFPQKLASLITLLSVLLSYAAHPIAFRASRRSGAIGVSQANCPGPVFVRADGWPQGMEQDRLRLMNPRTHHRGASTIAIREMPMC